MEHALSVLFRKPIIVIIIFHKLVPMVGLEPTLHFWKLVLSESRLPLRHTGKIWCIRQELNL